MGNPNSKAGKGPGPVNGDGGGIEGSADGAGGSTSDNREAGEKAGETVIQPDPAPSPEIAQVGPVVKKRGRPPKSDAERAASAALGTGTASRAEKAKLAVAPKGSPVHNDRAKFASNVGGLHGMAAVFLKQPALALSEQETNALSESVCAVADYHGLDLSAAAGPIGLYVSLIGTVAAIYIPRAKVIAGIRKAKPVRAAQPSTIEEVIQAEVDFTQGGAPASPQ